MENFLKPDILNKRRQDLPVFYRLNGAIYIAETDYLYKYNGFLGPDTFAYKMPRIRSIDIDSILDFELAERYIPMEKPLNSGERVESHYNIPKIQPKIPRINAQSGRCPQPNFPDDMSRHICYR